MSVNATSFTSPLAQAEVPSANLASQVDYLRDLISNTGLSTWIFTILAIAVAYDQRESPPSSSGHRCRQPCLGLSVDACSISLTVARRYVQSATGNKKVLLPAPDSRNPSSAPFSSPSTRNWKITRPNGPAVLSAASPSSTSESPPSTPALPPHYPRRAH